MHGYIVEYEIWLDGKPAKWGNFSLDVKPNQPTANDILADIQSSISERHDCAKSAVRVVGLFKV